MKPKPFGRYLLLDKVASGGMAEVWRAKLTGEAGFERIVAIKKILPHVSEDQDFITMFTDEAKITAQLQHSNVGQVYEFSKVEDIYFIGMEYISGKDLKTVWSYQRSRAQTIPIPLACHIVQKMADGLDYAHRKKDNFGKELGIIHRDVSPQNCIISWDGEVKVIDFGIAKAAGKTGQTRAGTLKGKFAYMSPEQIRGLGLTAQADVFALGIVLYEMVTGQRGFQADSEFSLLEMVRNVEIKPPTMVNQQVPQELERIIFKALAREREHRYKHASDLSEDLQRYLLSKGKPPSRQDLGKFLRENFTVDYDKERLRLEQYKEFRYTPPAPTPVAAQPVVAAAPPPASLTAVQAAMASETATFLGDSGAFANPSTEGGGTFASTTQTGTGTGTHPGYNDLNSGTGTGYVVGGRREDTGSTNPAARFAPPLQLSHPPTEAEAPKKRGSFLLGALVTMIGTVLLLGGGIAFYLLVLNGGSGVVTVTVEGTKDAQVMFDGQLKGTANPSLTLRDVGAGVHDIVVQKDGFEAFSRTITVESKRTVNLNVEMNQARGRFSIGSDPPGATIIIDGKKADKKTPAVVAVPGGVSHQIELKLPGFLPEKISKKVEPAETVEMSVKLRPEVLNVEVVTVPSGATVTLNAKKMGKTPLTFQYDPQLPYPQIVVKKKGCKDLETTLPLEKDQAKQKFPLTLRCK